MVNQNNTYLQLSAKLSTDVKLIPRVEEFMTSNGIIRQNFHEYIGKTLVKILSQSKPKKALNIMMYGQPSMGKTTELRHLTSLLCKNTKFQDLFLPLYSELQRAGTNDSEDESMWSNIRSGAITQIKDDYTLKDFVKEAEDAGKTPLIILDTLDILLIDEVIGKSNTMKKWSTFLEQTTRLGIALFWTCRPYEWNFFQNELHPILLKRTLQIELPKLQNGECRPFPSSGSDNIEKWQEWTRHLQSQMPLFAGRWSGSYDKNHELTPYFFEQLEQHIYGVWNAPLNGFDLTKLQYPSTIFYHALWESIHTSSYAENSLERSKSNILQQHFETFVIQNTHITRTHRLRFKNQEILQTLETSISTSTDMFVSQFVQERTLEQGKTGPFALRYSNQLTEAVQQFLNNNEQAQSNEFKEELSHFLLEFNTFKDEQDNIANQTRLFFDLCVSTGLISTNSTTNTFEFTHQLLFEETLATQNELSIESYYFPSLALRFLKPGGGKDLIRREAEKAQIHWTGAAISFHPDIGTVENVDWNLWIEEAYKLGLISNLSENEMNEKSIIMDDYFESKSNSALFLRGAPGTGKTYFCLNFIMEHLKRTSKKLLWRYVTLNRPLVDSVRVQWEERASLPQNAGLAGMEKPNSGPLTVKEIILSVLKESDDIRNHNKKLLDFLQFKEGMMNLFSRRNVNPPSFTDAWSDFTTLFHHTSGSKSDVMVNLYDYEQSQYRSVSGNQKQIALFAEYCLYILNETEYVTYAHASYLARTQLSRNRGESKHKYDMLMIDEVQDIDPSTMALLLLLLRPKFDSKAILVAGDDLQTVNRSGFQWFNFCQTTLKILSNTDSRAHLELNRLLDFGISQNVDADLVTLKQVYRNAPKIAKLNDVFRNTFAHQYPSETMPNYPREFLKISDMAKEKNTDCRISIIYAPDDEHILRLRQVLASNSHEISKTSRTAIITPYESTFGDDLESIGNFTTYNGETVKGLEFSGVIVFNPYEMMFLDAEGNLSKGLNKSDIENRIRKWMKRESPASKSSVTNFLQLYQNIMTRMNVLLSRPEYRLLLVSRYPFPQLAKPEKAIKINTYYEFPESIIFSLPTLSTEVISELEIEIFDMGETSEGLDNFILSTLQRQENSEGYSINNYLRWALDESQIGNFNNERLLWQRYLEAKPEDLLKPQSQEIPYFSTLLLAGTSAAKPSTYVGRKTNSSPKVPTILTGFRTDFSEKPGEYGRLIEQDSPNGPDLSYQSSDGICELFLISLINGAKEQSLSQEVYFSLSKLLQPFMQYVLQDAQVCADEYPYILELLLSECFGLSLNSNPISDKEEIIFDINLKFDEKYQVSFTPPTLDTIIERSIGGRINLDPKLHILDKILLYIYDKIDHKVVDYVQNPLFELNPDTNSKIQTTLHIPSQTEFWSEVAVKFGSWDSIFNNKQAPSLLLSAIKREELSLTLDLMLNPFSNTDYPPETSLDDVEKSFYLREDLHTYIDHFIKDSLHLTYVEMSERGFDQPNAKLFNSSRFWQGLKNKIVAEIDHNHSKYNSHLNDKTPLRSTWYYNWIPKKQDGSIRVYERQKHIENIPQSLCLNFIGTVAKSLHSAHNWGKQDSLAVDVMLFTGQIPDGPIKHPALLKEIQSLFSGDIIDKPRIKLWYDTFLSKLFLNSDNVNQTELNSYRMDSKSSKILETELTTLFKIINEYYSGIEHKSSEEPSYLRELFTYSLYRNILLFAPTIFSDLGGGSRDEQEKQDARKKKFAEQISTLIDSLPSTKEELEQAIGGGSDALLLNRIPTMMFTFDVQPREPKKRQYRNIGIQSSSKPNPERNFGEWLAILLFGALEHNLANKNIKIDIRNNRIYPKDSDIILTKLKIYFELFFEKADSEAFFSMFYGMINCGNYYDGGLESIGVLTPVRSHFNISRRTAFFTSSMLNFIDSLDKKPDDFILSRNKEPFSFHPVYLSRSESGIDYRKDFAVNAQEWDTIRNSEKTVAELSDELRLHENVISKVRKHKISTKINLIPFEIKGSRTDKNHHSSIKHPRMAAFDLAVAKSKKSSTKDQREWIIKNLNGLSSAYRNYPDQRRRLIRHICHAAANTFLNRNHPIPFKDTHVSIGRALAVSLLRTPEFKDVHHYENHQLDWRLMYEMMRIGTPTQEDTFDTFIEKTSAKIAQITKKLEVNSITLRHFLSPEQITDDWFIPDLVDLAKDLKLKFIPAPGIVKQEYIDAIQRATGKTIDSESALVRDLEQQAITLQLRGKNTMKPNLTHTARLISALNPVLEQILSTRDVIVGLNEFYNALNNPLQYLFADTEIFSQDDFIDANSGKPRSTLPPNITPDMLFFYSADACNYEKRKEDADPTKIMSKKALAPEGERVRAKYNQQILFEFVRYIMFKAGYRTDGKVDNSVEIEDIVFTKYDDDE